MNDLRLSSLSACALPARRRRALATIALGVAAFAWLASGCGPRTEGLDPSSLPENVRGDYDVFARKCSKCHGLSRPLQSGITDDEQWVLYVRRMRRQPGSGISHEDEEVILRFLRYYAAELRAKEAQRKGGGGSAPSAPSSPSSTPSSSPPPSSPSPLAPAHAPPATPSAPAADGGAP